MLSASDVQLITQKLDEVLPTFRDLPTTLRDNIINSVKQRNVRAGDILLLLVPRDTGADVTQWLGTLPLADRGLSVGSAIASGMPESSAFHQSIAPASCSLDKALRCHDGCGRERRGRCRDG